MNLTFQESILFYDCEMLFQATDDNGQQYLADFKAGRIGLRQLLLAAPNGEWHTATLGPGADTITTTRQPLPTADCPNLLEPDYYLPPAFDSANPPG